MQVNRESDSCVFIRQGTSCLKNACKILLKTPEKSTDPLCWSSLSHKIGARTRIIKLVKVQN